MKKSTFLKVALVAVAMFMFTGANAQNPPALPYDVYDANVLAPTNVDYVTLRTGGTTTMGYYALPDPVYHAAGSITALFVWNWTIAPVMTITKPGAANYVEIAYTATGNYVVNVTEQAPAAYGGCVDLTPTVMNVTVIAPPAAVITTPDPAQACGNQAAAAVAMTFTEAVPAALAGYAFSITEEVDRIDDMGALIANVSTNTTFVTYTTAAKLNTTNDLTGAASPYGFTFNTSALDVHVSGNRTRYTYTLRKATDAPGAAAHGLISAISEKSDYIAATVLTYPFVGKSTYVAIVNPTPVTGPIYHIPNTYAY